MSASVLPPRRGSSDEALAWRCGPLRPHLSPGEVHVWRAQLTRLGDRRDLLSEVESARERQIASERERQLWARSRSALRLLLARYLDTAPEQVPLAVGANGKPSLRRAHADRQETDGGQALHFNLSHSGELVLYAFSSSWPVGIDVELAHTEGRPRDHVTVGRRAFGEDEARRLQALSPAAREREFLRLWTRHEAALKRVGQGIGAGASGVAEPPWIVELDLGAEAAAALAGGQAASVLRLWQFS